MKTLDEMTSGLQKSDLVIIAARPSMGKTAFAINIAENAAVLDNKVVGVFSLEMSREVAAAAHALLASAWWIPTSCAPASSASDDYNKLMHALDALVQAPIFHRRHAGHLDERNARQGAPPETAGKAGST